MCHGRPWELGQKGSNMGKIKTGMKNEWVTHSPALVTLVAVSGSVQVMKTSSWPCFCTKGTPGLGKTTAMIQANKTQLPFPVIFILILAKPLSVPDLSSKPDSDYRKGVFFSFPAGKIYFFLCLNRMGDFLVSV